MRAIEEYFTYIYQLVQGLAEVHAERFEEQRLSATRGNLRIRLRFSDQALLEISEAVVLTAGELRWLSYRYHYQDPSGAMLFRYDNAPHHPEIPTYPDHMHAGDRILASAHPSIEQVLQEVRALRSRARNQ
jgi:predicted ATPase